MKLIIDIPKATYDYWKEHKDDYVLSEAIANAIPYDDSGDLISRSALKEYVKKVEDYESAYTICAYIDNAPTVEPERPKGEWIETDELWETNRSGGMGYDYGYYFKCSICDKRAIDKTSFCPNCGADMRGGAE